MGSVLYYDEARARRYFVLRQGVLFHFASYQMKSHSPIDHIMMEEIVDVAADTPGAHKDRDFVFRIATASKALLLSAQSAEEMDLWVRAIARYRRVSKVDEAVPKHSMGLLERSQLTLL